MNSALPRCQGLMFICGEGLVKVGWLGVLIGVFSGWLVQKWIMTCSTCSLKNVANGLFGEASVALAIWCWSMCRPFQWSLGFSPRCLQLWWVVSRPTITAATATRRRRKRSRRRRWRRRRKETRITDRKRKRKFERRKKELLYFEWSPPWHFKTSTVHVVFVIGRELHMNVRVVVKAVRLMSISAAYHSARTVRLVAAMWTVAHPIDVNVTMVFASFLFYKFHGCGSIRRLAVIPRLPLYEPARWQVFSSSSLQRRQ